MNHITYRFTLDLAKHGSQTVLSGFKVGDTNRAIDVALSMNGEPYYLGADQAAQLRAKYIGENEVIKQRYACEIKNGRVYCKIEPELLTAPGEIHLDLEVGDLDSDIFSTASFIIFAKGTVSNDEEIPAENYKSVITALANSENALKKSISTAEVDKSGNLVFTLFDETQLDCGNVIGPQGPKGERGEKGDKGDKGDVDKTALAEVRRYKYDYDCNGVVDINDAFYLLYHVNYPERYPIPSWCNADFNGDGVVNEDDANDMMAAVNAPSHHPHLYDTDARTADYSIVANALKGTAIGEAVSMKDVSPLEHNIGVKLASKNLLPYPYKDTTITKNGVTFTINGDGSISLVGESSASIEFVLSDNLPLVAGTYTYSFGAELPDGVIGNIVTRNRETGGWVANYATIEKIKPSVSFTLTEEYLRNYYAIATIYVSGGKATNVTLYPQIELGTTATAYTPYVADVSSVTLTKCGKNVLDCEGYSATGYEGDISNAYGTTLSTAEATNQVTITQSNYPNTSNPNSYANGFVCLILRDHLEDNEDYTISFDVEILNNPLSAREFLCFQQGVGGNFYIHNDSVFEVGKKYRVSKNFKYYRSVDYPDRKYLELRIYGISFVMSNIQIELGTTATEYEPRIEPITYTPKADGTVAGVTSLYPTTTLLTDTEGVTITAEYNKDLNKAFAEIYQAIATMGAPVMTIPEEII